MCGLRKLRAGLLAVLIIAVLGSYQNTPAQDTVLKDLKDQPVELASYKGKPVILFFWTTWCPYCREELKGLNLLAGQLAREGIVVLGVNVNEPDYKVKNFFKGYQLNFRMLLDNGGLLADQYDLVGVPTYVLLDKQLRVVARPHSFPDNYKNLLLKPKEQ